MDEIPAETRRKLVREVERVDGVLAVEQARVRRAGAGYFADLTLALPRRFTFEHTDELVRGGHRRSAARAARRRRRDPHRSRAKPRRKASSTACAPWRLATTFRCTSSVFRRIMGACRWSCTWSLKST